MDCEPNLYNHRITALKDFHSLEFKTFCFDFQEYFS